MVRIVVGYDASPAAKAAVAWVADRATRGRTKVELVTVTRTVLGDGVATEDALEEGARTLRNRVKTVEVDIRSLDGSMPNALIEDARAADLLVLGVTQGHPVRTALRGWIPAKAAARAKVPTVLVPEGWTPNEHPVMVGVDDDPSSDAAIRYGAREATVNSVPLRLVHAWQMPTPTIEGAVALISSPIEVKNAHRRILDDAGRLVTAEYPEIGVEDVLVNDNPPAALLNRAERTSLLVIGTHHRGLLEGAAFGSVAQDILWRIPCPVCIVPNDAAD